MIRAATSIFNVPETMPTERTYCILGQGRGGTSMVAKIVDILGVPLIYKKVNVHNCEDGELRQAVTERSLEKIKDGIADRNSRPVWGWKMPQVAAYMPFCYKLFRNPFWIYIARDHVASMLSEIRLAEERNRLVDPIENLKAKLDEEERYHDFIQIIMREHMPLLLVSHERCKIYKGTFILNLVRFLGTNPPLEAITTAVDFIREFGPNQGTYVS